MMNLKNKNKLNKSGGYIIPVVLVFMVVFIILASGIITAFNGTLKTTREILAEEQAVQIAEAGVDYYKWHLAHDPDDYRDGQTDPPLAPSQDGLLLWLSASDINGNGSSTPDNTPVSQWIDKSPQGNHLEEIPGQSVPQKITDDGMSVVEFTEDRLQSINYLYPSLPIEDVEIYILAKTTDTGGDGFTLDTLGRPIYLRLPKEDNNIAFQMENGINGEITTPWNYSTNEYYLWTMQNSTSQGKLLRNNGVLIASSTEDATGPNNFVKELIVGGNRSKKQDYQSVNIAEILVYDRTLLPEERVINEKFLDCGYGVTVRFDCGQYLPGETYGPFIYPFYDKYDARIGEFELYITTPKIGSTVVTLTSIGKVDSNPLVRRTVQTKLAIPSFVKYAFASDSDIRFGEGTEVFGPIHSNGGVRFDGIAHNIVTSSRDQYDDPDHSGENEFGVHTHTDPVDPLPPDAVPDRFDVFQSGREFPVPAIDFAGMVSDLATMKEDAISAGEYLGPSGSLGYKIVLKNDDTFDVHTVTSLYSPHWSCYDDLSEDGWGSWSVQNTTFVGNFDNPPNGVLFIEDDVWVEGVIDTARLTIAVATFPDTPSTRKNITVNNDLLYTNYDGSDIIALIAQNNVNVGLISEDDLRVDAAMLAQSGRIGRYHYKDSWWFGLSLQPGCTPNSERDTITLLGTIGSRERYGFAWTDGTGYTNRNIVYDSNLLYSPPPSFPLTTDQYEVISWEEIKQ